MSDEIDTLRNNFNVHEEYKTLTVEEIRLVNMQDRLPFAVCAWNIDGNLNIGMIIRTACNMGAERIIVIGRRAYDKRSCVGSNHYLPIDVINAYEFETKNYDVDEFWRTMLKYDYTPIFFETGGKRFDHTYNIGYYQNMDMKPCLVFGSESEGLPPDIVNSNIANTFSIPQLGVIRSYNVSAAAAIAMWELVRGEI